ncbi:bacillithiol biosynthesis cysteine-adding enzyme BshC [Edaphobacter sp. 12200R-103]|uniref:bacillithiol biosynthesis cysteine-adding enzyme BshC n=1 Tax=Edaphobacter sp. 12200R-103 TaxID=2703788 RepID=UPI00138C4F83|nr:bacillithiol biosynthesis cysteine-adding enzyme BshC [Edaphobacter sp. 12200R-103]QHS50379.1 bacillithiol biosynthesis cysteine-adding enzyme BshC [Edaphobacter sp. 12200R-103]
MSVECYPITVLPHISQLYRDYLVMGDNAESPVRSWYGSGDSGGPFAGGWMKSSSSVENPHRLAEELLRQNRSFGASAETISNIEKLREGARAVVTGQQVVLFGGPLLTLLKASAAISRAREATRITGIEHVPVFWMATEDHDLAEVDQAALLTKTEVEVFKAGLRVSLPVPVGDVPLNQETAPLLEQAIERATELLEYAPVSEWIREAYLAEGATLASAFGKLMARIFAQQGLVIVDAASREFHAMGASTLQYAIEHADELRQRLLSRTQELTQNGYHAQVLVSDTSSLLFLLDAETGERLALRPVNDLSESETRWRAGSHVFSKDDLLKILERSPERLSPNALLRPVFQDTVLPTAAYIGGPAEIAYFAQSEVLYRAILGRVTSVLPRLSATLIEPAIDTVMQKDEIQLSDAMTTADELALRLGARAMPIPLKRKLAAVGNALETELDALTEYLRGIDASLGTAAETSGSKMRYQMDRLRRMAANFGLQKEASLKKHAAAITLNLYPDGHPQERLLAGAWFLARYGDGLIDRLVQVANNQCPGHVVVRL